MEATPTGAVKFPEVDSLPGAEDKAPLFHDEGFRSAEEAATQMGIAVALPMAIFPPVREIFLHGKKKVMNDIGIGIFIDGDGGSGVRAIHKAKAAFYAAFAQSILYLRGDIIEAPLRCG